VQKQHDKKNESVAIDSQWRAIRAGKQLSDSKGASAAIRCCALRYNYYYYYIVVIII
jgi:hypothetical protein